MFHRVNRYLSISAYKKISIVLLVVFITSLVLYQGDKAVESINGTTIITNNKTITENNTKNSTVIDISEIKPPPPQPTDPCAIEIYNHASEPFGDKLVVVASYHQNLDWICEISNIPHIVYTRDKPSNKYNLTPNNGYEASVYLKFIIDYYDRLPNSTAFVHGHRYSWHTSRDATYILTNLRWHDYPYLDFNLQWQVAQTKINADYRVISENWDELYREYLGELPDQLNFYCCGQFVVSRERIRLRPLQFYQQLFDFVIDERISTYSSSHLLEYTWSYILGEPANRTRYPNDCHVFRC